MNYRWNWGNGQVGETRGSRIAARNDAADNEGNVVGWMEFYAPGTADAPGDWFRLGTHDNE